MLTAQPLRSPCLRYCLARSFASVDGPKKVAVLKDTGIETFKAQAFELAKPALLPHRCFKDVPAVSRWFTTVDEPDKESTVKLNEQYLSAFDTHIVPLELTTASGNFARIDQPLSYFLSASKLTKSRQISRDPIVSVYLAQASLSDLPPELQADVPKPAIVLKAGRGDIYSSSIWLGEAPTNTPLHRDPNPNLFIQLAGRKIARLFPPKVGQGIFAAVQDEVGGIGNALIRGEEMMMGKEKVALEAAVWGDHQGEVGSGQYDGHAWSAELESGDALFIPKGWWHSIKGVGNGMTGSVNWWFR
ncbi:Clavaminate synthase-like protein [Polychaeton citri CBS 116435]|uniref:Clavaminate synthase-like protein n=1 Tax=Polychaeton citri CBS 116435 TaxID=1314669 RepID=A0A9P4UQ90_9PEZI|nr:Clavaminate synthase-like protein [Polychaeton citri CBS 116435]